jgi:hypothetical protein
MPGSSLASSLPPPFLAIFPPLFPLHSGIYPTAHHTAMATPPLHWQQPAPKPSIIPLDSDSQHSFTYFWKVSNSSTLIALISVAKSEFSCDFGYPTMQNAAQTSPFIYLFIYLFINRMQP